MPGDGGNEAGINGSHHELARAEEGDVKMEMIVVKNTRDGSVVLMMYGEFLSALERGEPLEPVNKGGSSGDEEDEGEDR